jgi:hypothetical protein
VLVIHRRMRRVDSGRSEKYLQNFTWKASLEDIILEAYFEDDIKTYLTGIDSEHMNSI